MDKNNYFIKKGYKNQKNNRTLSVKEGDIYWIEERVRISAYYQREAYSIARKLIKKYSLKNVVDVGCGSARKLMEVIYPSCSDVTGIDQKEAIEYCIKHYPAGTFLIENLEEPKLSPGKFDMIIAADVIEHMENPDKLLSYIKKLANKDSYIVISTPERDVLRGKNCMGSPKPEHIREWNKQELLSYLKDRGFNILSHQLIPVAQMSLLNKEIRNVRKSIRKNSGTVNVNQVVVCQVEN